MLVAALFTENGGEPATGLALAAIDVYLYRRHRTTGVVTAVWNPQPPTQEIGGTGLYEREYGAFDHALYHYYAYAEYTGAVVLDSDFSLQCSANPAEMVWGYGTRTLTAFGVGSIEFTYTVYDNDTGLPISGVSVWIATDAGSANVIWRGTTDVFGVTRDPNLQKPWLDPGTYFFFRACPGYTFINPNVELISS